MMTASQQAIEQKTTLLYKRPLASNFINTKDFKDNFLFFLRVVSSERAPKFEDRIEIIHNICSMQVAGKP